MKMFDGYDQFINWIPESRENGKIDKIPIGTEGFKIDPLDPKNWMSESKARSSGRGVGFVFTEGDPFFFIDLDNHFDGGKWSNTATSIYSMFPGCAMEISQSGKGGHIFGCGKPEAPYRNTNKSERLEFYTEKRFVALTGTGWTGDTAMDGTAGLSRLIPEFFLKDKAAIRTTLDWTSEPVVEWKGETDDEKLIAKAKRSRSVGSVFGGKASFSQLFQADEEKLAVAFPPDDPTKTIWDNSSADMALCLHLAFWTGKDCGRIERIFDQSRLGEREKWRDREDYRKRTILKATEHCKDVYGQRNSNPPNSEIRTTVALLDILGQLEYFKGCVYIPGKHEVFTPARGFLKPEAFRATYGGFDFVVRTEGASTKNAFRAFTESQLYQFPKADRTCFRPELPPGEIVTEEGLTYLNTYTPAQVSRQKGDITPFNELLTLLLPIAHDRTILLAYMAACVQYPGVKFQWAPLLQGVEGNGKSFLARSVSKAVGERYTHYPNARDLDSKFTGWMENKLFIVVEEIRTSDRITILEALKPLITNPRMEIQAKGQNQYTGDNRANYFLCSNHKDAILKTQRDRRYCVFYAAQQEFEDLERDGMTESYFSGLYGWAETGGWAKISEYLLSCDIPEEFNPAKECRRAPVTSSTSEALTLSLSPIEQDILEAVEENLLGFRGGWISSTAVSRLFRYHNHTVTPNKRRAILEKLGYVFRGRMSQLSDADEAQRPTLYCIKSLRVSDNVDQAYLVAQGITPSRIPQNFSRLRAVE